MKELKDSLFSWVNLILAFSALIISLIPINSDALRSAIKKFDNKSDTVQLKDIIGNDIDTKIVFVFCLDISRSLKLDNFDYLWLEETIERVNARMPTQNDYFDPNDESIFNFCKVRLASFLLEIEKKDVNFAVWKFGNVAEKIYPLEGNMYANANSTDIVNSIMHIKKLKDNDSPYTNIRDMFEKIKINYLTKDAIQCKNNFPSVVLVMISDLIHDVRGINTDILKNKFDVKELSTKKHKKQFSKICAEDRTQLKDVIKSLAEEDILVNIIVLKEAELYSTTVINEDCVIPIWHLLIDKDGILNSQRRKGYIWNDNKELIYPILPCNRKIKFFYKSTDATTPETSTVIEVNMDGNYSIGLKYDFHIDKQTERKLYFQKGKLEDLSYGKIIQIPKEDEGKLISGASSRFLQLKTYEGLRLTYKDPIPLTNEIFPYLEIRFPNSVKIYHIPIEFEKELDPIIANILKFFLYFVIFVLMFLVMILLKHICKLSKGLLNRFSNS